MSDTKTCILSSTNVNHMPASPYLFFDKNCPAGSVPTPVVLSAASDVVASSSSPAPAVTPSSPATLTPVKRGVVTLSTTTSLIVTSLRAAATPLELLFLGPQLDTTICQCVITSAALVTATAIKSLLATITVPLEVSQIVGTSTVTITSTPPAVTVTATSTA